MKASIEAHRDRTATLVEELNREPGVLHLSLKEDSVPGVFTFIGSESLFQLADLPSIRHVFIDGTHALGPQGTQVVAVLALLPSTQQVVPIAYLATNGATDTHYAYLLRKLKERGLNPTHIHKDMELAIGNAAAQVWPHARTIGCYFHYLQAVRRRFEKIYGKRNKELRRQVMEHCARIYRSRNMDAFRRNIEDLRVRRRRARIRTRIRRKRVGFFL